MSRGTVPILVCDDEDGCDAWTLDDYGMDVSAVNNVIVTATERSPGWQSTGDDTDLCPEHKAGS